MLYQHTATSAICDLLACFLLADKHRYAVTTERFLNEYQRSEFPRRVSAMDEAEPGFAKAFYKMEQRLLVHGGRAVVPLAERLTSISALLERAVVDASSRVQLNVMQESKCHANSAKLWAESLGTVKLMSGYALSNDGLWRQHSWVIDATGIVETTEVRDAYFGVELTLQDSVVMLVANHDTADISSEVFESEFWSEHLTAVLLQLYKDL